VPGSPSGHVPRLLALKFKCTTTKHNATLFLTGLTKALEKKCVVLDMHEYISNIEKGTWLYNYYYGHTCKIKAASTNGGARMSRYGPLHAFKLQNHYVSIRG